MINKVGLSEQERRAINGLLSLSAHDPPEVEDIWKLMDIVWDEMGCDGMKPFDGKTDRFYSHPIWLLNTLFIEQDPVSMRHRNAIADWVCRNGIRRVLDYGGGGATCARLIVQKGPSISVDIYEPYPSAYAKAIISGYSNIRFVDSIHDRYGCIISIDVLEHVSDPLKLFAEMVGFTRDNGYLVIAHNFYPIIECHLPSTFHLRHTFDMFVWMMGLNVIGRCGDSHAKIYQKSGKSPINWKKIKTFELFTKILSLLLTPISLMAHKVRSKFYGG